MLGSKHATATTMAHITAAASIGGKRENATITMQTAKTIAKLEPDGVKIHMLCALEGTKVADMYRKGEIVFMSEDEYVSTVCDFLEFLPAKTTIHRLAGNGLKSELVAPRWIGKKLDCLNKIDREFLRRDSWQGIKYPN